MTASKDLRGKVTIADLRQMLQDDVEAKKQVMRGHQLPPDGIGGPGYVEEFVLTHGREYPAAPWPTEMMTPTKCFGNAGKLVQACQPNLTYVEGFAISASMLEVGFALPTHHAWVVNEAGEMSDPTFRQPENSIYLGVPIPTKLYLRTILRTRYHGVFYPGEMLNVPFFREYARMLTNGEIVLP